MRKLFAGISTILLLAGLMISCGSSGGSSGGGDLAAPGVELVYPTNSAVDVPINVKVTAAFDMVMKASSISVETFYVRGPAGAAVAGNATLSPDGLSVVYTPSDNLASNTVYTATLTIGVQGLEGNPLDANYEWSFTTGATADTTAPTVLSTVPANGASVVALDANISAAFSEAMDPLTINSTSITLKQGASAVAGTVTSPLTTTMIFNPTVDLSPDTVYTATISTQVKDVAGNVLATEKSWSFTTRVLSALGPNPIDLGLAGTYAILAETGISTVPPSVITGNIGVSPAAATYMTGFSLILPAGGAASTSSQVTGFAYAADYEVPTPANLTTAIDNRQTAYTVAAGLSLPDFVELHAGDLSGKTLVPGLYKWGTSILINENLTLSGSDNDVWVFQISGDVTMAANKSIILSGSALPKNVFWQVAGGAGVTINAGSHFIGIVMTATEINLRTGASIEGRLLSHTAVNLQSSTVTQPAP